MSIASITINCDDCHIMEEVRWEGLDSISLYLQRLGWEVMPVDEHYCPECAKKRRLRREQVQKGENNA